MSKLIACVLTVLSFLAFGSVLANAQETPSESVIVPGKLVKLNDSYSYNFEFVERPKLGPATLRVQLFDQKGEKTDKLSIAVLSYMVTMKGHHDERRLFAVNKSNGNYLTGITFVMRGEYKLEISFFEDGKLIHTGSIGLKI
jgi:hypothetical protein